MLLALLHCFLLLRATLYHLASIKAVSHGKGKGSLISEWLRAGESYQMPELIVCLICLFV